MLEQITQWFQDGGASLVAGLTALGGGVVALKSVVGTFSSLKEVLPQTVQDKVDESMVSVTEKISEVKTSSDQFKLQETVLNCKAKLSSSVLSDEMKAEYLQLMTQAQGELRDVYGVVVEIPSSIDGQVI